MTGSQRFSKKRQAIYDALCSTVEHPSAEMVYQALKPVYPDLSLGTVYRNIKGMLESGDVVCVGSVDGCDRYDASIDPHAHMVCCRCGAVVDMEIPRELEAQCHRLEEQNGIRLELGSLRFGGMCKVCKELERSTSGSH